MKRLLFLLGLLGCGDSSPAKLPPPDPATLSATLQGLAQFGNKHVGTMPGAMAGDWVSSQMQSLGLADVHFESFQFPRHDVLSSSLAITGMATPGFDVFDGSGSGHAEGDLVYVHEATAADFTGVDVTGKVVLVDRSTAIHRSVQYTNIASHGGVAMLYVSLTPNNLRQVGSVRLSAGDALGPIPALCIGGDDGMTLKNALAGGQTVHAVIDVQAVATRATGRNVIGTVVGKDPAHGQIIVGAHYDTWFTGSVDNGGGVATVLALAARRVKEAQPRYSIVFIAYDGEEVGLYGGYDYLRKHHIVAQDPILAVLNFEMPASADATTLGLAHSNVPVLDGALRGVGLSHLYPFYAGLDVVPSLFGGVIPTDIQGTYRNGVPTATTATDTAWYHTTEDTPEKVDVNMLAKAVDEFDAAIDDLQALEPAQFAVYDDKLWRAPIVLHAPSPDVAADVTVTDAMGAPQANATVDYELFVDDFFRTANGSVQTDATGKATITLPASAVQQGQGNRFLHVTSGQTWPLVESIAPL